MIRLLSLLVFSGVSLVLSAQTVDSKGRKQGAFKKTDLKTGKVIYEGTFKDDKPVGIFRYYYPSDSIRAIVSFHPKGTASYARLFHPGGKRMAEGRYSSPDTKDSVWTYYDESGTLLSRETYVKGKKEGKALVYLRDGAVAEERSFKNNLEQGPFKAYFDGTRVKTSGSYLNGRLEGRIVHYYPNGMEAAAGFYKNGEKNGPWIYRSTDGKVTEKELYKMGQVASPKETDDFFTKNPIHDSKPSGKTNGGSPHVKEN